MVDPLALARVEADTHFDAELVHALADRRGAPDRPRWAVEGGEEGVTGGVELSAAEADELPPDEPVVRLDQLPPAGVAELSRPRRRANDVCEKHRRQNAVRLGILPGTLLPRLAEETLGLSEPWFGVAGPLCVLGAGKLDVSRSRNALGQVPRSADDVRLIACAVQDERRDPYGLQRLADVDLRVHTQERGYCARACALTDHRGDDVPGLVAPTGGQGRRNPRSMLRRTPPVLHALDVAPVFILGQTTRVVGGPALACVRADKDERPGALRIRGGEQNAHRATFRDADECGAL